MAKNVKAAILRARHDNKFDYISDDACIKMLMTNSDRTGVLNYWEDNTYGYLDFVDSELFPWVDISIDLSEVKSRDQQVDNAYQATKALVNHELDGFDIFIVLIYPGEMRFANALAGQPGQPAEIIISFDGGAGPVANNKPACAIPVVVNDHTFMCHETGHTLGFQHSYGVLNFGESSAASNVYGDPYDVMSSASFGFHLNSDKTVAQYNSTPEFSGASAAGWPVGPQIGMGPAPAKAHVYLWDNNAVPDEYIIRVSTPGMGETVSHRIFAAEFERGPHLIIVDPPSLPTDGTNRCFIEFRTNKGWDAGLDISGTDLARQAVVVHTSDITSDGLSPWYRGQIKIPLEVDADVQVPTTPLTITVTGVDPNFGFVDVEISSVNTGQVLLTTKQKDDVVNIINTEERKTKCGDVVNYGTLILQSTFTYDIMTFGFGYDGDPNSKPFTVLWKVAGIILGDSGSYTVVIPDINKQVICSIDSVSKELILQSSAGEAYNVAIEVTVAEADGSNAVTQTANFNPPGQKQGYSATDIYTIGKCLGNYLTYVKKDIKDLLAPVHPNYFPEEIADRINTIHLTEVANDVAQINTEHAEAINSLINLRYPNVDVNSSISKTSINTINKIH